MNIFFRRTKHDWEMEKIIVSSEKTIIRTIFLPYLHPYLNEVTAI